MLRAHMVRVWARGSTYETSWTMLVSAPARNCWSQRGACWWQVMRRSVRSCFALDGLQTARRDWKMEPRKVDDLRCPSRGQQSVTTCRRRRRVEFWGSMASISASLPSSPQPMSRRSRLLWRRPSSVLDMGVCAMASRWCLDRWKSGPGRRLTWWRRRRLSCGVEERGENSGCG